MKKILEIHQYGETDIRFHTDLKPSSNPDTILDLISSFTLVMTTSLRGGNEMDILAIIRLLAIADLSVSENRNEMIQMMDQNSKAFAEMIREVRQSFEHNSGKVIQFDPGITPGKTQS